MSRVNLTCSRASFSKWYGCWPRIDVSFGKVKFGLEEIGDFIDVSVTFVLLTLSF